MLDEFVRWCTEETERLRRSLALIEVGTLQTGRRELDGRLVDTTPEHAEQLRRNLAELAGLIERHRQGQRAR